MPIYDFKCDTCGDRRTQLVRGDTFVEHLVCPKCGGCMSKVPSIPASPVVRGFNAANGYSKDRS